MYSPTAPSSSVTDLHVPEPDLWSARRSLTFADTFAIDIETHLFFFGQHADESETGHLQGHATAADHPAFLVEGAVIAAYAIGARHAFIYLRGEVVPVLRRLQAAVAEAYDAGYLGRDIGGSGLRSGPDRARRCRRLHLRRGDRAAGLARGPPRPARLRPPFPAVAGLYACPTVVNNVESIASVPPILANGVDWFKSIGTEKSPGFTLYSLSGQ